jgi:hemoglobin
MIDNLIETIGEEPIVQMTARFYEQIPEDDILGPMYQSVGDFAGAEERLRDFLLFRFGGPRDYLEKRGHPALRMRHAPFALDQQARNRWIQLMDSAIDSVIADEMMNEEAAVFVREFFAHVATFLMNRK